MTNIEKKNSEIGKFLGFLHNGGKIKPLLEDIHLITLEVAGLEFSENIEEIFSKLKKGDHLELFRENKNPHDELAILVKYDGEKIGYVPRKHNQILANLMDGGKQLYGIIDDVFEDKVYKDYKFKTVIFRIYLKE